MRKTMLRCTQHRVLPDAFNYQCTRCGRGWLRGRGPGRRRRGLSRTSGSRLRRIGLARAGVVGAASGGVGRAGRDGGLAAVGARHQAPLAAVELARGSGVAVVGEAAMQSVVQAAKLRLQVHAECDAEAQELVDDPGHDGRIRGGDNRREDLNAQETEPPSVEHAALPGEDSGEARSDEASDAMAGEAVQAVVGPVGPAALGQEGGVDQDAADESHAERAERADVAGGRGDHDETDNGAGNGPGSGVFLRAASLDQGPSHEAGGRGNVGVHHRQRPDFVGGEGGATVEPGPTEPEQRAA
mmetsp:Transcript_81340/g.235149  ORF Transcript_81340/g.235149 Transcript_81340/m.235149 type:complete len:299 (+) Transcript_81340:190-1086(+)